MSGQAEAFADTEGTTSAILQSWSKIRHKSSTIFIVDTSIKTTKPVLDSIKQQVSSFISTRVSEGDLVSLISSSTNSDVLAATSSDTSSLESAMNRMTTSGGTAIRDGLIIGFDLFAEERSQKLRRAIVAFVSSKDTSSKTAVAQLLNRGNQLVGRRNVQLYVLGIDGDPGSFGDLPGLVNTIGGTFLTTRQGDLPTTLAPILKQIE
jgi:Mg-chelatase subunit ChlD